MWCRCEPRLLSASPIWRRSADKALSCFVYRRGENKLRLLVVVFLQTSNHYPLRWFEAYLYSSCFFKLLVSFSFVKKRFFYEVFVAFAKRLRKIVPNFFRRYYSQNELNAFLVNKTKRRTEIQFYWYYDSTCFGQLFCPSSGVLSRTSALVHFMKFWWPFATRSRMEPDDGQKGCPKHVES